MDMGRFSLLAGLLERGLIGFTRCLEVPALQRVSLRIRLCLLVAIILVPALMLAGKMSLQSISVEQAETEQMLRRILNQVAVEIEKEIRTTTALLAVLGGSQPLQIGDLEGFHRRASEISTNLGLQIVLHRPQLGKILISTGVPWGEETPELTMPEARLEAEQKAMQTGKVVITDIFLAPSPNN